MFVREVGELRAEVQGVRESLSRVGRIATWAIGIVLTLVLAVASVAWSAQAAVSEELGEAVQHLGRIEERLGGLKEWVQTIELRTPRPAIVSDSKR